MGGGSHM